MDASNTWSNIFSGGGGNKSNPLQQNIDRMEGKSQSANVDAIADQLTQQWTKSIGGFTKGVAGAAEQMNVITKANKSYLVQMDISGKLTKEMGKGISNVSKILRDQFMKDLDKTHIKQTKEIELLNKKIAVGKVFQGMDVKAMAQKRDNLVLGEKELKLQRNLIITYNQQIANSHKLAKSFGKFSDNLAGNLTSAISSKLSKLPLIGGALSETISKKLGDGIKKTLSKMMFKRGNAEEGFSIPKLLTLISTLGTAAVATAGLALVVGGLVVALGAAFKLFKALFDKAVELDEYALKVGKSFGIASNNAQEMAATIQAVSREVMFFGIETEKVQESAGALLKTFGTMQGITTANLLTVTKLSERWGVAAETGAGMIQALQRIMGYGTKQTDNFFSQLQGEASVAGVSFGGLIEDIAGNMDLWVTAGVKNVKNLTKASIEAKKMGLSLDVVGRIQEGFEDLDSTIEKSSYINFVTGRNLNPMKLYSMSQMGDVEGLLMEAFETAQSMGKEFNNYPVTVQKDLAKMFNMSVVEFSKMTNMSRSAFDKQQKQAKDWGKSLEQINGFWDQLKATGQAIISTFVAPLAAALTPLVANWRKGLTSISKRLSEVFSAKKNKDMFDGIQDAINKVFYPKKGEKKKGFWEVVGDGVVWLSTKFQEFFTMKDTGPTQFEKLLIGIKEFYNTTLSKVVQAFQDIFDPDTYKRGGGFWKTMGDNLSKLLKEVVDSLQGPFADLLTLGVGKALDAVGVLKTLTGQSYKDIEQGVTKNRNTREQTELEGKGINISGDEFKKLQKLQTSGRDSSGKIDEETLSKGDDYGWSHRNLQRTKMRGYGPGQWDMPFSSMDDRFANTLKRYMTVRDTGKYDETQIKSLIGYNLEDLQNAVSSDQREALYKRIEQNQHTSGATGDYARGGYIRGAGSSTSDSIPANLSNGEFVVSAAGTSAFRPVLESMNLAAGSPSTGAGEVFNSMNNYLFSISKNVIGLNDTIQKGLFGSNEPFLKNISLYYDHKLMMYKKQAIEQWNSQQGEAGFNSNLAGGGVVNAAGGKNISSAMSYERNAMKQTGVGASAKPFAFNYGGQTVVANTGESFYPISGAGGLAVVNPMQQSLLNARHPEVASSGKMNKSALSTLSQHFKSFNKANGGVVNAAQGYYNSSSLAGLAKSVGFQEVDIAQAVAMAESGGNPRAFNGKPPDMSYGLWQINMLNKLGPERRKQFGITSNDDLFDPVTNAKAAYMVSGGGKNWKPWSTYTDGKYKNNLKGGNLSVDSGFTGSPNLTGAGGSSYKGFNSLLMGMMPNSGMGQMAGNTSAGNTSAGNLGSKAQSAIQWAMQQGGKPYKWGGAGPEGYDCSGFMSAATNVLRGEANPYKHSFSTADFANGNGAYGFKRGHGDFTIGVMQGNPGHMSGTIGGWNLESRGGKGVVLGDQARGADNPLYTDQFYINLAEGGFLGGGEFGGAGSSGGWTPDLMGAKKGVNSYWDLVNLFAMAGNTSLNDKSMSEVTPLLNTAMGPDGSLNNFKNFKFTGKEQSIVDLMYKAKLNPSMLNRKGIYESIFPSEKYRGTSEQNSRFIKHITKKYVSQTGAATQAIKGSSATQAVLGRQNPATQAIKGSSATQAVLGRQNPATQAIKGIGAMGGISLALGGVLNADGGVVNAEDGGWFDQLMHYGHQAVSPNMLLENSSFLIKKLHELPIVGIATKYLGYGELGLGAIESVKQKSFAPIENALGYFIVNKLAKRNPYVAAIMMGGQLGKFAAPIAIPLIHKMLGTKQGEGKDFMQNNPMLGALIGKGMKTGSQFLQGNIGSSWDALTAPLKDTNPYYGMGEKNAGSNAFLNSSFNTSGLNSGSFNMPTSMGNPNSPTQKSSSSDNTRTSPLSFAKSFANPNAMKFNLAKGGVIKAANGYNGVVDSPTMFMAGETGMKEHVDIKKPEDTSNMLTLLQEIRDKLPADSNIKFVKVSDADLADKVIGYITEQTQTI